ncbi:c-type cytochrome [Haliea sp. E1-2-M8]|uniref:c-type cytochrome n=1 Tax=Haliea sp. E1-2-M8 TaxID=3064706 RepID=UPI002717DFD7|nr:c-type cytochrome [Haliea sp. E1-2-M8]MDO8861959.1 c-type cytochrome [Haliea sp. E1-2-M8]
MKKHLILGAALLAALVTGTVQAQPPAQAQACVACHGSNGVSSNPAWPNLAGQHETYLAQQLVAMRSGERSNPLMAPFVRGLSDEDIKVLAAWYAAQELATAANGDADLVERGRQLSGGCTACHGYAGKPVADAWPILAGQHAAYLQAQLLAYKHDVRIHPFMQAALAGVAEKEFEALASYYSQLQR